MSNICERNEKERSQGFVNVVMFPKARHIRRDYTQWKEAWQLSARLCDTMFVSQC